MNPIFQLLTCLCLLQIIPPLKVAANAPQQNQADSLINNYLFIEWKHGDSVIVLGRFTNNGKKREAQFTCKISSITKEDIDRWLGEKRDGALLLFHCMWGQQAGFHQKKYLRSTEQILARQPPGGIHTEISFIWHAGGVLYRKNWDNAAAKGGSLGQVLQWINEHYQGNIHALCHSMGNRFFEGIVRAMPSPKNAFKTITLFSADLSCSSSDADFINCANATPSLYVYVHHKDRFLLLSAWLHGIKRLGRTGPEPAASGVTMVDMTGHTKGLQNHTHLDKPWVQEQLAAQLLR
jgi:hypothetical protein